MSLLQDNGRKKLMSRRRHTIPQDNDSFLSHLHSLTFQSLIFPPQPVVHLRLCLWLCLWLCLHLVLHPYLCLRRHLYLYLHLGLRRALDLHLRLGWALDLHISSQELQSWLFLHLLRRPLQCLRLRHPLRRLQS